MVNPVTTNNEITLNSTSPILFGSLELNANTLSSKQFIKVHSMYIDFIYLKTLNTDSKKFLAANVFAQADLLLKVKKRGNS